MELISRLRPVLEHRYEPTMSPTRSQFAAPEHVEQSPTTTKIGRSFVDNSPRPKERNWRMQRPFVQETAPTSVAGLSTDIAMLKIKEMTAEAKRKRELRQQASRIPVPQSSGKPAQKATNYWKDAAETTSSLRARLEKLCDAQNNMKSKRCLVGPEPFEKSR